MHARNSTTIGAHNQVLLTRGYQRGSQSLLYILKEIFTALHFLRSPEPLVNVGGAQSLGPRFFEPMLHLPNHSL